MKCLYCHTEATDLHHIIPRSQMGSNNALNLAPLCRSCHSAIHFGTDTELRNAILAKCYEQIKKDLSLCYKGRIKPKIVNILENA